MEHAFHGPRFTLGIEEELMIVDAESHELVSAIDRLLGEGGPGEVKPELFESVLEIAVGPCEDTAQAGERLRGMRREANERAERHGLTIGSSGTHPFARWEEQRIVAAPRYRDLISALRFVARQELIFGMHVHVGVDDPDAAIYVADQLRLDLGTLLALSANSPFWRGQATGLQSSRTPVFRQFPRVGVPPAYGDWAGYEAEVGQLISTGIIEDYTYLWYDVRAHPKLGTVEVRVCDSQTRVEHTLGLAALIQAMVRDLCMRFDAGEAGHFPPWQMLDENKWLAARHGLDGELFDLRAGERISAKKLGRDLVDRLTDHATDLGSAAELEGVRDLIARGGGAHRQIVVYEANQDLRELTADLVQASRA